jgi:pyruvate/2-oxoglutarate dehydrogenase complex dihydrolipoamide dehydrogenase (E3) component
MLDAVAGDMEPINQRILLDALEEHRVKMLVRKKVAEVTPQGAVVEDTGTGERHVVEADVFVLACGVAPVTDLIKEIQAIVAEVYVVGDCQKPRTALDAIAEGFLTGNRV